MIIPCASRFVAHDGTVHGGGANCVWNKSTVLEYLGSTFSMVAFYNQGTFNADNFDDDDRIEKNSSTKAINVDSTRSSWTESNINKHELIDIIDLM